MKILIVDASFYMYKAFYGSPEDPKGGIRSMMFNALDRLQPDSQMIALDAGKHTFRSDLFPSYKANRPPSPEGFSAACESMREAFSELCFTPVRASGYEADDVAGSLCAIHSSDEIVLMTKDKDWMQLVRDGVSMWHDGVWTREAEVVAKFGVPPHLVTDVMGLSGDSGDGIPGVPGIGAKIATKLVAYFGQLESIYGNLTSVAPALRGGTKICATLAQSKDMAFLSRTLATIRTDVDLKAA